MQRNKIDFIADLLADKRIDIPLKEKTFELASKEVKESLSIENENLERILEIENRIKEFEKKETLLLNQVDKNSSLNQNEKPKVDYSSHKVHKPKDVADFMSLFNSPNGLKYLTHDFDESEEFNIEDFLVKSNSVFKENTKLKYNIPASLWQIVNQFAFEPNPTWGTGKSMTDGWSKPKWVEWSKKYKKHLKRNPDFEKIIENFRNYTRIESPKLTPILNDVIREKFGNEFEYLDLKITDCDKADFYTQVDNFKQSIKLMLDGIKKRIKISNKISINYIRKTNSDYFERIISICHHDSFPTKPLDEFTKEISKEEKGELSDMSKKLRGYCNWSIETIWDNQPVRVNILQEGGEIGIDFLDKDIVMNGFTHILTFYYK